MSLVRFRLWAPPAGIAHLVERHLAKVEVASSSLVARSKKAYCESNRLFLTAGKVWLHSDSDAPPCKNQSNADQAICPASVPSPCKNQRVKRISACDGIGRHARFRFSCRETCGFESLQAHHEKSHFCLPTKVTFFNDIRSLWNG